MTLFFLIKLEAFLTWGRIMKNNEEEEPIREGKFAGFGRNSGV